VTITNEGLKEPISFKSKTQTSMAAISIIHARSTFIIPAVITEKLNFSIFQEHLETLPVKHLDTTLKKILTTSEVTPVDSDNPVPLSYNK
jgi:hypothetical protein